MKPSFLIIGGQKCGTTSLYTYLCEHPQILPASRKEVNFFTGNFEKGINWYLEQFPAEESQDLITGEASPNYIFYPHTPKRVFQFFPKIKLILLLRDPVERAISHYHHNLTMNQKIKGKKREPLSFEEAIERENLRIKKDIEKIKIDDNYNKCYNYNHYSYLTKGIYIDQLKRWMEFVPREQLLILKSEDFFQNPNVLLQEVLNFLDLPGFELQEYKQVNRGVLNIKRKIDNSIKLQLHEYFQPYNQQLEEFLGIKFYW
ncbi:MAG: sulfotransferase domain-containing protein [Trichodesmium sp. MAG_R03]|nr:sulfotransferase domain-containing protein [Trichodesmium sp. MAG_R03]MDE5073296.1 sulfotransferase domain-containing protein [Trichodesmium sp. St5_bin8]